MPLTYTGMDRCDFNNIFCDFLLRYIYIYTYADVDSPADSFTAIDEFINYYYYYFKTLFSFFDFLLLFFRKERKLLLF